MFKINKKIALFLIGIVAVICSYQANAANAPAPQAPIAAPQPTAQTQPINAMRPSTSAVPTLIPAAPDLNVKAYILVDAKSNTVVAAKNPDDRLPPASMTKIMSLYLVADSLKNGKIKFTDAVPISEKAWRTGGSRMFAKVGSTIPVQQMIDGIIIASGNDATVAMAEFLAGTEDSFADLMNQTAAILGMNNSHFVDSNGLPAAGHYSSARDMATLARAWIYNFPEYYPWFKSKWIVYNGIKQPNRNRLLWRDPSVDGMKTGHTEEAGYCLTASAERDGTRFIAVILGAPSDKMRAAYSESLLNYGFRFFESHKLYNANTALLNPKVRAGKERTIPIGLTEDLYVTTPHGQYKNIKINVSLIKPIHAPIRKGDVLGTIKITLDGKEVITRSLVALKDNAQGGFFSQFLDYLKGKI
ncbi:MAG: D-alanyl-D-alanine carboxypeptidase family protein [Gammaproteobacteria bacterium]|jgi:D-alanyl-D-alanine carboxypeptidase (penicillin-binding protein 5/6)